MAGSYRPAGPKVGRRSARRRLRHHPVSGARRCQQAVVPVPAKAAGRSQLERRPLIWLDPGAGGADLAIRSLWRARSITRSPDRWRHAQQALRMAMFFRGALGCPPLPLAAGGPASFFSVEIRMPSEQAPAVRSGQHRPLSRPGRWRRDWLPSGITAKSTARTRALPDSSPM